MVTLKKGYRMKVGVPVWFLCTLYVKPVYLLHDQLYTLVLGSVYLSEWTRKRLSGSLFREKYSYCQEYFISPENIHITFLKRPVVMKFLCGAHLYRFRGYERKLLGIPDASVRVVSQIPASSVVKATVGLTCQSW